MDIGWLLPVEQRHRDAAMKLLNHAFRNNDLMEVSGEEFDDIAAALARFERDHMIVDRCPEIPGHPECKIESYNEAREIVAGMGYASITEALEHLEELRSTPTVDEEMLEALRGLLNHYVQLVNCGDCGYWNPEVEDEVVAARAAIVRATTSPAP